MWLGKENIPAILWALQLRIAKQRPDMVVLEWVPSFDIQWLEQLSGNFLKFCAMCSALLTWGFLVLEIGFGL